MLTLVAPILNFDFPVRYAILQTFTGYIYNQCSLYINSPTSYIFIPFYSKPHQPTYKDSYLARFASTTLLPRNQAALFLGEALER